MSESGSCTRYSMGRTFAIVLLILGASFSDPAIAQDCHPAKQRIYRITETEARQVPDSLQTLLDLVAFVRDCENEISLDLELWLLINEVLAFDGLERYEEASLLVTHFFEVYFDEASDLYRARFYLWRLHMNALSGTIVEMITDYAEAQQYAHALDTTRRAGLYLDGAYAYREINQHETTLALTQKALDLIGTPQSYDERNITARALLSAGEAHLWLGTQLSQAKEKLRLSARLYGALGDTAKVTMATTVLGMVYAAEGDTSRALATMIEAAALAQQAGSTRSKTYTLYRQGQLLRQSRDFQAAQPVLLQAFEAATAHREFYLEIACELARLHEQRRQFDEAARYYRTVVEAPKPSGFLAMLKARQQVEIARASLALIENERQRRRLHLVLGGLLVLVALVGSGLVLLWRRPRRLAAALESKSNGMFIPRRLPTGRTLDNLVAHFRKQVKVHLLGLHLAYLFATLFEPELILPHLDDPWLIEHLEQDNLPSNAALFRCIAAAEETLIEDQSFGKDPANTLRAYLSNQFKIQGWTWPTHPTEWKQHFVEHHIEHLL